MISTLYLLGGCWGFPGFAFFRTILHVLPIASPFLAPFKGQITALTYLGFETVFGFSFHVLKITGVVA
jgi:hypothetical protein